jgi:hypothetical protein
MGWMERNGPGFCSDSPDAIGAASVAIARAFRASDIDVLLMRIKARAMPFCFIFPYGSLSPPILRAVYPGSSLVVRPQLSPEALPLRD